ncbi:MAG: hypothetical protein RIT24_2165, partial [Planctomycetota bacterium]
MKTSTSATLLLSLAACALLVTMPAQFGSSSDHSRKLDAELAELGITQSMHFSETDDLAGSDSRWGFPSARAAQLSPGQSLTFVLPGGRAVSMPLAERMLIDERSVCFVFRDLARGHAATITVRSGVVRGTVYATIDGVSSAWSLATATDVHGVTAEYYEPLPAEVAGDAAVLGAQTQPAEGGVAGGSDCQDNGQLIDVLVAYTPAFAARFSGIDAMQAAIAGDIGWANGALSNASSVPRFRIAGFAQMTSDGTGSLATDVSQLVNPADNWNDEVHAARNSVRADLVMLCSDSANIGFASVIGVGAPDGSDAFSAIGRTNATGVAFSAARALGTNLGCCSQLTSPSTCSGFYAYSHAWKYIITGTTYQTVMATGADTVIPIFSNPLVDWLGQPSGTVNANNARTASLTALTVANYRCSSDLNIDCDADGVPDQTAIASNLVPDCNFTGIPDSCDIAIGISLDLDANGVPDECPVSDVEIAPSGIASMDTLGSAVGISSRSGDPEVLGVIGVPGRDIGASNAGAATFFSYVAGQTFLGPTLFGSDATSNAFFGRAAATFRRPENLTTPIFAARDYALIGAYRWTEAATVGTFPSKGRIYLFARDAGVWSEVWRYSPPATGGNQARENALFGYSLAFGRSPRENAEQIIVGAPGHTNGQGKVYLMRNYLPSNVPPERAGLLQVRSVAGAVDGDNYGAAVALDTFVPVLATSRIIAVVGAPGRNGGKGATWILERGPGFNGNIGSFTNVTFLLNPPASASLAEGDRFGTAVAICDNLIAIGAPGAAQGKGIVYFWERRTDVFNPVSSTWQYRGFFKPPDGADGDRFGSSISIAQSAVGGGFTVVVGAPKADVPLESGLRLNAGKVYVLHKTVGAIGAELRAIRVGTSPATGDEFGYSAASVSGLSIIGAPFSDVSGLNSGKAR